jgi:hypothetical protein
MPVSDAEKATVAAIAAADGLPSGSAWRLIGFVNTTRTTKSASVNAGRLSKCASTAGDTAAVQIAASLRRQQRLGDLHEEAEALRDELARDDWAYAPRAEFDRLVSDIYRWRLKVGGAS